jgi:hypothetical protein
MSEIQNVVFPQDQRPNFFNKQVAFLKEREKMEL